MSLGRGFPKLLAGTSVIGLREPRPEMARTGLITTTPGMGSFVSERAAGQNSDQPRPLAAQAAYGRGDTSSQLSSGGMMKPRRACLGLPGRLRVGLAELRHESGEDISGDVLADRGIGTVVHPPRARRVLRILRGDHSRDAEPPERGVHLPSLIRVHAITLPPCVPGAWLPPPPCVAQLPGLIGPQPPGFGVWERLAPTATRASVGPVHSSWSTWCPASSIRATVARAGVPVRAPRPRPAGHHLVRHGHGTDPGRAASTCPTSAEAVRAGPR